MLIDAHREKGWRFLVVLKWVVGLDAATKLAALLLDGPRQVIPGLLSLRLLFNDTYVDGYTRQALEGMPLETLGLYGLAMGALGLLALPLVAPYRSLGQRMVVLGGTMLLGGVVGGYAVEWVAPGWPPRWIALARGLGVQLWLLVVLYSVRSRYAAFALSLLWAGNAGNLLNTLVTDRGVVDFLYAPLVTEYVFNVADACVTGGAALLVLFWPLRAIEAVIPLGSCAPSRTFDYTPRKWIPGERHS